MKAELCKLLKKVLLILTVLSSCFSASSTHILSITPSSISFGNQIINSSVEGDVTITNSGSGVIQVQAVTLAAASGFALTGWSGRTALQPGQSLQLGVVFTPTAQDNYSATLTLNTNASDDTVAITGVGVALPPSSGVNVSISPATSTVQVGKSQQFSASVIGATNSALNWLVNGVQGGNSTAGTVSSSGFYSAPNNVPSNPSVVVTAAAAADPTSTANATVTIMPAPAPISVSISPANVTLQAGVSQQFTATLTNTPNTAVTWSATTGSISSSGLYTAPTVAANTIATVTATSVADPSKSASATVSITAAPPAVAVFISPTSATVSSGGTQQFTATVSNTTNTAVTWSATAGSVSSAGLYTAPPVTANTTATVSATSVADPSKSANATVSITAPPPVVAVSISPTSATVASGGTQQFTATVTGSSDTGVLWSIQGTGTISSTGLFTAPAVTESDIITATSHVDPTKTATATVIVVSTTTSNNYYVSTTGNDSNDGTASDNAHAWRTITHAGSLAVAGDTVHVLPGTYNGNVNTVRSGTATSRITYLSDTKWEAKIVGSGSGVMWDNSASYIDVIGFDISGPGCVGLDFYGVNDRAISNNVHNGAPFSTCSGGGAGIDESGLYAGNEYLANFVHDVGISDSLCGASGHKGVHGLYKKNPGKVINNVLINNCAFGVHAWSDPHNMVIVGNTAIHNLAGGIIVTSDTTVIHDISVRDNIAVNNGTGQPSPSVGLGLLLETNTGGFGANIFFTNNLTFGNNGGEAIDNGTNQDAPVIDIDGGSRPVGLAWDIGGYEFGSSPAAWPWY